MIEIATTPCFKTASLETKSTGLSTVNYVDTNKSHKKYIKVVASTSSKRLTFESYLYEKVLAYTARKLHRPSLLSVRGLSIQIELGQNSKGLVSYYIERPFVEYSLK